MSLVVSRGCDPHLVPVLASLFLREVTPAYISHSEVQLGRAQDFEHWSQNLEAQLVEEFSEALSHGEESAPEVCVIVASVDDELAGFALLRIVEEATIYAVLEDLVVSTSHRRCGVGEAIVKWAEEEAAKRGAMFVFLESGLGNTGAHEFFARQGFHECSVVMAKKLQT